LRLGNLPFAIDAAPAQAQAATGWFPFERMSNGQLSIPLTRQQNGAIESSIAACAEIGRKKDVSLERIHGRSTSQQFDGA